jgi:hypothetical protein
MAVTWNIEDMKRDLVQGEYADIVTSLQFKAKDSDANGNSHEVRGTVNVELVGTPTPYADITEAQAIEWVKDALGADFVASIETNIATKISAKANPTTASGVSW